jgi:hypothetical protein
MEIKTNNDNQSITIEVFDGDKKLDKSSFKIS